MEITIFLCGNGVEFDRLLIEFGFEYDRIDGFLEEFNNERQDKMACDGGRV